MKQEKLDEKLIRKGFEAGATMAYLSVGKFEKDEDNENLKKMIDALYSEFVSTVKHGRKASK